MTWDVESVGGYTTGSAELIQCLRQRSRPYIFSNSLAPPLVNACIAAFDMISSTSEPRDRLLSNAKRFREQMVQVLFCSLLSPMLKLKLCMRHNAYNNKSTQLLCLLESCTFSIQ